jgi:glutamate formiminotransferase
VLDINMDADHNRSVITFAGSPDSVMAAAVDAAGEALARIDLRNHTGVHPRIGALDVLPFVPVAGITLAECAGLAVEAGERIWDKWRIPVYLYEAAARISDRVNLANVRKAGVGAPDIGGPDLHPSAGAIACGARKFLIAYNVNLRSDDLTAAREIAAAVRGPAVKALGLRLPSHGIVQVSMNLIDFERTPIHEVFDAVRSLASARGIEVLESELIGLLPRRAWEMSRGHDLLWRTPVESSILEDKLDLK